MRRSLFGLASAVLLLAAAPARAQSLYGPGGLFLHPTASLPPKGRLTPGLLALPQRNPEARATRTWISGSLDYGLRDDLEIGFTALQVTNWNRDPSFGGFVKYRILKEGPLQPQVAIGYTQLGFGDVNTRTAFLAARKQVAVGKHRLLVFHVGVQYAEEIDGIERDEFQPYAGIELGLTSRLSFIVEGRPRGNRDFGTPLALTLSYRVTDRWRLAATWANNGLSDGPRFGIGAGLSLGSR